MPLQPAPLVARLRSWNRQPLTRQAAGRALVSVASGLTVFTVAGVEARRRRVVPHEEAVFRQLNDLPDHIHRPVWVVMQSGSLASVGVATALALVARKPVTAVGLGIGGFTMWGGAKLVKHRVGRGRPAAHIDDVNVRGREQTGLGFPSGHAAVAFCLATVAAPATSFRWRGVLWVTAGLTAASRMYVGAHLPLDIIGGIGLGVATGGLTNLVLGRRA